MGTYGEAVAMHKALAAKRARARPRPWLGEGLKQWPANLVLQPESKQRRPDERPIPKGYQDTSLQLIPMDHMSSRWDQDYFDELRRAEIRRTPPGPRRDYLVRSYELWIQNGRPTYGGRNMPKHDRVLTWQKGTPLSFDFSKHRTGQLEGQKAPENKALIRRLVRGRSIR